MKLGVGPRSLAVLAAGALLAGAVWARATPDELARLGKSLTCTGGEKAGTASGVPEFTGKWLGTPPGIQYNPHAGLHPVDPYASEKPLFTITAENLAQYAERLTEGQKAMFAKYPRTYRIPVYQGHRDFRFSDAVCAAARKNAQEAVMNADGQGTTGAVKGALPFPFPRSGLELASTTCCHHVPLPNIRCVTMPMCWPMAASSGAGPTTALSARSTIRPMPGSH